MTERMPMEEWVAWTGTVLVPPERVCRQWARFQGRCRHCASAIFWAGGDR